jgi:hypothetical protein
MLEESELLLRPRNGSALRAIVAADSGKPLGFARWNPAERRPWWRWLVPGTLEVREQEDESLLFTLRRAWTLLAWYEICDADGVLLGRVIGRVVQDHEQRCFAVHQSEEQPGRTAFVSPAGLRLARLKNDADGIRLTFATEIEDEPFLKMLLLGAALYH